MEASSVKRNGSLDPRSIERGQRRNSDSNPKLQRMTLEMHSPLDNRETCDDIKCTVYFLKLHISQCAHHRHPATPAPAQEWEWRSVPHSVLLPSVT